MLKKLLLKINSSFFKMYHFKHIKGEGRVILNKVDSFLLKGNSIIVLNKNLTVNLNRFDNKSYPSLVRLDNGAVMFCDGFSFHYGADVILFENAKLYLGEGSYINSHCKIRCSNEIRIGKGCSISHDVTIIDSNFHYLNGNIKSGIVDIKDHVWIGTRVIIMPGVTIGEGSVIGAGSVVTKSIPENCLACGNPARVTKINITWK